MWCMYEAYISYTFLADLHSIAIWIKSLKYPVKNVMENALAHKNSVLRSGSSLTYSKKTKKQWHTSEWTLCERPPVHLQSRGCDNWRWSMGWVSLAHLIQRFAQELFARTQQVAFLVLAVKFRTSKNLDEGFFSFKKKSIRTSVVGQLYFIVDLVDLWVSVENVPTCSGDI